jgi:6-phosphofructokinase 2
LTLNAALDVSCEADRVRPTDKIRTHGDRVDPGGGGINVSRVLQRLGAPTHAIVLAGGETGRALDGFLALAELDRTCIRTGGETRVSLTVFERSSGQEYRFVPEGPVVAQAELDACARAVEDQTGEGDYLVASGSLPRGAPDDFYARLCASANARGSRFVLDSSGPELKATLARGGAFLVKPSRAELEEVVGRTLPELGDVAAAARSLRGSGGATLIAVTMGPDGALLADADGERFLPAVPVAAVSAVGAGDSFLAAMVKGLASGLSTDRSFRLAVAAGAAAVICPGTGLSGAEDVDRLLQMVPDPQQVAV